MISFKLFLFFDAFLIPRHVLQQLFRGDQMVVVHILSGQSAVGPVAAHGEFVDPR